MTGANAPSSRRRFWIVVLCFAVLNAAAWVVYDRHVRSAAHGLLHVEAFEPGNDAITGRRPTLRWRFNTDVIPTAAYGKDPATISPAVSGKWTWENPRTLTFTPDSDLPESTRVSFTLADTFLRGPMGSTLDGKFASTIQVEPLAVEYLRQSATDSGDRFILEMKFNDRVFPSDVLRHLTVTDQRGTLIHCNLVGHPSDRVVRLETEPLPEVGSASQPFPARVLNVKLSPGLCARDGNIESSVAFAQTVDLSRDLAATQMTAMSPLSAQPFLRLAFNSNVAQSALQQIISVDPKVDFALQNDGGSAYTLVGDFHPQTRYTVTLAAHLPGTDPAEYPKPGHLSAFMPDRQSGVWLDNEQGYLSSAGNRTLLAHTVNVNSVRVAITRVYDNNLVHWRNNGRFYSWGDIDGVSKPIVEKTFNLPIEKNIQHDVRISLDELLPASAPRDGVYRVVLGYEESSRGGYADPDFVEERMVPATYAVVTLSDIALTAKDVRDGLVVWATSIRSAQPLANIRVRAFSNKNQPLGEAITDANGLARICDIHPAKDESVAVILADRAPAKPTGILGPNPPTTNPAPLSSTDLTWLALRGSNWETGDLPVGGRSYLRTGYEAFLYTDRGVYRPGETVHLRAIVRGPGAHAPQGGFPVRWQIRRPDQRNWQSKVVMLDADGAAAFDVQLLPDLPTGQWTATLDLPGSKNSEAFGFATFDVEEFVPSRMKVKLSFDHTPRASLANGPVPAQIQADYLFGRPAAGLTTELATHLDPVAFAPAGWTGWSFGDTAGVHDNQPHVSIPHIKHKSRDNNADKTPPTEVTLDPSGHYAWSIDAASALGIDSTTSFAAGDGYAGPWRLTASAGVREAGGRAVTAVQHVDIDALPRYLAVRRDQDGDAAPGSPCPVQIRLVRPDGQQADSHVPLVATLQRVTWNCTLISQRGRYEFISTRVFDTLDTDQIKLTDGKTTWSPTIPGDGQFVITVRDPATGAFTSIDFNATDGRPWNDNISRANPEHLDVRILPPAQASATPSRNGPIASPTFKIGQTAQVAVGSPFPGKLLLTVETDDVLHTQVIDMPSTHVVVQVPVTEACRPNAFVTATVVRAVDPNAKWQAHRAFGVARLRVDPNDLTLNVAISAPSQLRPNQSLDVNLAVTDPAGRPAANSAVTVAAVDEGICMLTDFPTPDPVSYFAADRALGVRSSDIFDMLMPEVPLPDAQRAVGGDRDTLARHITPIVARRFVPVALAWQTVHTDANGLTRTSFSVPEFEGRLRVMAIAYNASATGSSDAPVTVRSPVLAQSSWPRFAAPGDEFSVPIVLFNNTASAGQAVVTAQLADDPATPAGLIGFGPGRTARIELPPVMLPAMGQRQISLPAYVGQAVGVAKLHMHVAMGDQVYDEHLELPIRPPAPRTQFAGALVASPGKPTAFTPPAEMLAGTGDLAIHITPWPTLHLPEALDYLDRYPYGCVEQTTSGCFPLLALSEFGKQIDPKRFDPTMVKIKIDAGINQLLGMQTSTGGLAMWPGDEDPWPWGSIYAAHFLVEAKAAGFDVPDDLYRPLLAYVRQQLDEDTDDAAMLERQAYASLVLCIAGTPDRASLSRLVELSKTPNLLENPCQSTMRNDAMLMLACAWALAGRHDLATEMLPDALPTPRPTRENANNIGSPIRDRALLIYTLASVRPTDPRLPGLVQALADSGLHQTWDTQECAFATLAIGKYLHVEPKPAPYDSATLLAGANVLATAARASSIDWSRQNGDPSAFSVKIAGTADSAAFVTWIQSGVPLTPPPEAFHGIVIHRQYLTSAGMPIPQDRIATGELVRVRLTLTAPAKEQNLVIEDLLPAGLEAENSALKTSAIQAGSPVAGDRSCLGNERMDIRDDRVIVMGDMPATGSATIEYLARAVTPGTYVIPPVRAEAMYDIALNGISGAGGKFTVQSPPTNVANIKE